MHGYRYPFTVSIHGQVFGHTRRYAVALATRKARERQAERVAKLTPYFLVCLQREGDSQLMVHSELKTNRAFMETVIESFAAHAPEDARLVIKNHPLDPGLSNLERIAFDIAATHAVQHRVSFLEGGGFAALARASRGVVGVNSTAALAAVGFGVPVKLLFVFFCGFNVLEASQPSMASRIAPAHSRGAAMGVYNTLQSLGFFAGGVAGGWLVKHLGAQGLFTVCTGAMLLWLVVAWPMTAPGRVVPAGDAKVA